ncbi:probable small heat shock protein (plasmid) [Rhizobium etli CIAT 652]|nr:probable small heat shock protein [Rhizobium etli CIAT 652]
MNKNRLQDVVGSPEIRAEIFSTHLLNRKNRQTRSCSSAAQKRAGSPRGDIGLRRVSTPCCFTEDMAMRNELDFAPLYRSSIGFDRVFNLLNNAQRLQAIDAWPPYDIVKTGEDDYRIQMAVAGFAEADLEITQERNVLLVKGQKNEAKDGEYLHRGIAGRTFERRFELADHVRVENASLMNGILSIALKREVPEAMKPRKIAIGDGFSQQAPLQIDAERQVA